MEVVHLGVGQFLCTSTNSGEFGTREFIFDEDDFDTPEFGTRKSILDEDEDI